MHARYSRYPRRSGRASRLRSAATRPLPSSVATALQEMGILQVEGAPPHRRPDTAVRREVEEWPRPVLLLLSLTCFLLLFGLIAWQPWR